MFLGAIAEPGSQLVERVGRRTVGGVDDNTWLIPRVVFTVDDFLPSRRGQSSNIDCASLDPPAIVIPANAETRGTRSAACPWPPAGAGLTRRGSISIDHAVVRAAAIISGPSAACRRSRPASSSARAAPPDGAARG